MTEMTYLLFAHQKFQSNLAKNYTFFFLRSCWGQVWSNMASLKQIKQFYTVCNHTLSRRDMRLQDSFFILENNVQRTLVAH